MEGKEAGSRGAASALRRDPGCLHSSPEPHRLPYCNGASDPGLAEWCAELGPPGAEGKGSPGSSPVSAERT